MPNAAAIGQLTELVTLSHRTLTKDSMGGATPQLTAYATNVWAKVQPVSGNESQLSQRTEAQRRYKVVLRHRTDMLETDVVTWGGRQMNVRFIAGAGARPLYLELECDMGVRI